MAYATVAVLGHALVRCQESDGSVNIEWRGTNCCVPITTPNSTHCAMSAESSESGGDCGGCRDEPIADEFATTRTPVPPTERTQVPDAPAPVPALAVHSWATVGFNWTTCPSYVRAPIPPPPLAAIRTVVLRC